MAESVIARERVVVPLECSPAPIDARGTGGNALGMNGYRTPVADDAPALPAAATRLQADPSQPASVESLASTLTDVEEALRTLGGATRHAADALIPPRRLDESASNRYARAAESWPDGAPPSYERQAQILAALHDAAATIQASAECCRRARGILASTIA